MRTPRGVAIVCSYGRRELNELLTMWALQTVHMPLLLYLDDAPLVREELPRGVIAVHSGGYSSIGAVRQKAIDTARAMFTLQSTDFFLILDDDDFYGNRHAEVLTEVMRAGADWVAPRRYGLLKAGAREPFLWEAHLGGPSQQAGVALRVWLYDQAGGYSANDARESNGLWSRIGREKCVSYEPLTYIRREGIGLMSTKYNRGLLRQVVPLVTEYKAALLEDTDIVRLQHWIDNKGKPWESNQFGL